MIELYPMKPIKIPIPIYATIAVHISTIFLLVSTNTSAQNLIPNPGFEAFFTQSEYQWIQPQGQFYHYEAADSTANKTAHSGHFINGICMYNTVPNEYFHIKLLHPLKPGQKYRLEAFARLMHAKCSNAEIQKLIGVHFGNQKRNTHIPGDLYLVPQVNLTLPDSNRFEWFQLVDTFVARGGEQYMTVGYFPNTQHKEARDKAQAAFMEEIERKYAASQAKPVAEDMSWLYLPPKEQKEYLKAQKKKKRKQKNGFKNLFQGARNSWVTQNESKIFSNDIPGVFASRYYFDDFCLVPVYSDGRKSYCKPENRIEKIEKGRTIKLQNVFFQTDSATLLMESKFQLGALYRLMNKFPKMKIEIRGYTDDVGKDAYNLNLSKRRAENVKKWLIDHGIDPERISAQGFGENHPVETNDTPDGRARNRRVTFYIKSI